MKFIPVPAAALAFSIAIPFSTSFAQVGTASQSQTLPPTIVTAARVEQSLADVLPDASVITRADIERSQAVNLLNLLQRLPGVEIAQLGGLGSQAGIFLRGAESRQVLVLIDGMPMNSLNFSIAALDQVMTAQVERVEVVRGNVSSLYGAQAVGGVISITTRAGAGVSVSGSYGSRKSYQIQGAAGGGSGGWHYGIALSGTGTDGFNAIDQQQRPGTNPDRDGYRNTSASADLGYTWAPDQSLTLRGYRSRGRLQYDSEFGPATQTDESVQTIESVSAKARNRLASNWISQLTLGHVRDALDASETAYPYYVKSTSDQVTWQNDITLATGWTATAAAEHLRQKIDSDTTYATDHRTVNSVRAGVLGNVGDHQLQANVRHDNYSDFGGATTGYLGYGYRLTPAIKLLGSLSNAFNAPTFNDLFYPYGGNPNLTPERSRSAELGLQFAGARATGRVQLFRTLYRDLIGYDAAYNRVNVGAASVQGAELALDLPLGDWRLGLTATYQDAVNDATGARLNRRARQFGNLLLARNVGALELQVNLRASGDRRDVAGGVEHLLGGYGLIDVAARWRVQPHLALTLRAENLFDHGYQNAYGYNGTPRGVFGGIEMKL